MEFRLNEEANRLATKARPKVEMEKLRLQWKKAYLAIEQAELKQKTNRLTAEAKEAEVDASENGIQSSRKIMAPLNGDVIEITPASANGSTRGRPSCASSKWTTHVEGMLNIKDFGPDQIANRPVKVMAQVGPNRVEEFQGKVVFIDPELIEGGKYRVLAEVVNRGDKGDGPWLLRPGMQPEEMVIDAWPGKPSGTALQPRTTPNGRNRVT